MGQGEPRVNGGKVLIALGGNAASTTGSPRATVLAGLNALRMRFEDIAASNLYRTPAFPAGSGPDFINAACAFDSDMDASDILKALHEIEAEFGRTRMLRWGQRTLDLDLIAHGQRVAPDNITYTHWQTLPLEAQKTTAPDRLILPHPRVQDRPFVLIPLADVAPDWTHPVLGKTVLQMIASHSDAARAEIETIS